MSRTLNIEKKFMDAFRKLCSSRSSYAVWDDLVTMIACSLSNAQEPDKARFDAREAMYQDALKRIGHGDIAVSCFAEILGAFMEDPAQDFLGTVYGLLRINSKDKGQFFTPYHVSDMMAKMMLENAKNEIKKKGDHNNQRPLLRRRLHAYRSCKCASGTRDQLPVACILCCTGYRPRRSKNVLYSDVPDRVRRVCLDRKLAGKPAGRKCINP